MISVESIRATLINPRESAFMLKFAVSAKTASKKRAELEKEGLHVPPFLIASITSSCNLHCAGCYSRCSSATTDSEPKDQLTSDEWLSIFDQTDDLGISYTCKVQREQDFTKTLQIKMMKTVRNRQVEYR